LVPQDIGELHLLQINIHTGAPQLLGAGSRQIADFAGIGRRYHNNSLTIGAGPGQRPLDGRIVARPLQHLDTHIRGKR